MRRGGEWFPIPYISNLGIIKDKPKIKLKPVFPATITGILVYPNISAKSSNIYINIYHKIMSKQS